VVDVDGHCVLETLMVVVLMKKIIHDQTLPNAKFNTHVPHGLGPKGEILLHR
jgi:hypothetical protein